MPVKSQDISDGMNIVYTTTLDNVPDIFNMLQNNQGIPELVNIFCNDETLSGLYNVVPTTQDLPETLDVVSTTCQETADLLNVMSSQEAQEILNAVTTTHESDMYNIVSNPQDISEIYIGSTPYDTYSSMPTSQTELYQTISSTPQLVPDAYTGMLSQDLRQLSNATCCRIDPQSLPVPTLVEVPKLTSITPKKRCTKPLDKPAKPPKSTAKPATSKDKSKTGDAVEINYSTDPDKAKSQLIELHNGKRLLIVNEYPYYFRHVLKTSPLNRWCCNKNSCNAYVHATLNDNSVVAFGGERHKHLPTKFKQQDDGKYIKV